jgi:hypothetical protein
MPICGVVLTLDSNAQRAEHAIATLRTHPCVFVGEPNGERLPIVLDTDSYEADKAMWNWLDALQGLVRWDVVYAHIGAVTDDAVVQEVDLP